MMVPLKSKQALLIILIAIPTILFGKTTLEVPKETYLTYSSYLSQKKTQQQKIVPFNNWLALKYSPPLIGKYQINKHTVLSISKFSGSIGDDLSNINRWRRQLKLSDIKKNKLNQFLIKKQMDDKEIKIISLNNNERYMTIYWVTIEKNHFFNKITSNQPINSDTINTFIESQAWQKL